jgi:hypothetical protein
MKCRLISGFELYIESVIQCCIEHAKVVFGCKARWDGIWSGSIFILVGGMELLRCSVGNTTVHTPSATVSLEPACQ